MSDALSTSHPPQCGESPPYPSKWLCGLFASEVVPNKIVENIISSFVGEISFALSICHFPKLNFHI